MSGQDGDRAEQWMVEDRGRVEMNADECKGCGLCVAACPPRVLKLSAALNRYGYHPSAYTGAGCTGCGICFYVCPEPGGIRVLRAVTKHGQSAAAAA